MTKALSKRAKVNKAFAIHQSLIKLRSSIAEAFILVGKKLTEIKEGNLYKYLGEDSGYDTFESYLASPELQISRRKAYYLMAIYQTFCEKFGLPMEKMRGVEWSIIKEALPIVTEKNCEEWIEKSKALSHSDMLLEVRREKTGIEPYECQHDFQKKIYWQCKICGDRSWIDPELGKNNEKRKTK